MTINFLTTIFFFFLFFNRHHHYHPNGPLTRYAKLKVAHAPGMPGTFSPPPRVSDPDMHHGTCVTHVPWCMWGSLTNGFLWSRWQGKRSRHSWRMHNPQFYVSGKKPIQQQQQNGRRDLAKPSTVSTLSFASQPCSDKIDNVKHSAW